PVTSAQSERFLELVADGWPIADAAWAAGRHRARFYDLRQADRAFDVAWRAAAVRGELVAERAARDTGGVARAHEDDFRTRNEADLAHGDGDRGSAASSSPSAASSADRGSRPGERGGAGAAPRPSLAPEKSERVAGSGNGSRVVARQRDVERKRAKFLELLCNGESVVRAAAGAKAGRRTVYDWRKADAEFAREWDDAWEQGADLL